jgi:predicted DNA-binding antitoxin AbrB/MazE fold protein
MDNSIETIHAVYGNGVFRPVTPVCLPEGCEVVFEPRVVAREHPDDDLKAIYEILSRRYETGRTDLAERHDEHQP